MITPNGRFATNKRLCLSISDFHPDTWNPAWSVATILTGLLSFMVRERERGGGRKLGLHNVHHILLCHHYHSKQCPLYLFSPSPSISPSFSYLSPSLSLFLKVETSPTVGSVRSSDEEKKQLAINSWTFNLEDHVFNKLFPELVMVRRHTKHSCISPSPPPLSLSLSLSLSIGNQGEAQGERSSRERGTREIRTIFRRKSTSKR